MKKLLIILYLFSLPAVAQISVTPFAGINSTRALYYYWEKGGNYGVYGVEVEGRLRPRKFSSIHVSFVTGASYLANGYFRDSGLAFSTLIYDTHTSELRTNYFQIPAELKLNWQPFPLVEDWKIFFGAGISNDFLLKSSLEEKAIEVNISSDLFAPPQTTSYEDGRNIAEFSRKYSVFSRFELGAKYKRIHFAYRFCFSLQDMHHAGLENVWQVPSGSSNYMTPMELNGKRNEKYSEFVLGFRVK
ncbi:MAG: outer membrane beta-barrel protein [Cyclobacteriaceae bacterium]